MVGKIVRVLYRNNDFVVALFRSDNRTIKVVGNIAEALQGDIEGLTYEIEGQEVVSRYGKAFRISKAVLKEDPLYFFLVKMVDGITERIAKEIFNRFENVEEVIENNPKKLLDIKGIGKKRYKKIIESYESYKPLKELSEFLLPFGVSASKVVKIYNHFEGRNIIREIKENPYILTEVETIGFLTADRIAMSIGIPENSRFRYEKAIEFILEEALTEGHTYLTYNQLIKRLEKLDIYDESLIKECIDTNMETEMEDGKVYLFKVRKVEEEIIEKLLEMNNDYVYIDGKQIDRYLQEFEEREGIILTEKQRKAVELLKQGSRIFLLSGYAGTGKTTVLKAIMYILSKVFCKKSEIVGCAFTGIASDRMRNITGFESKTIHSLLEWNGREFKYGKNQKLPYKVVVLDEATMVDIFLFRKLLNAVNDKAIFILVGDPAQLPPLNAGNIFVDLVESGIFEMVKLTQIMRTSKDNVITLFANEVRKGIIPKNYKEKNYKDFFFIEKPLPSNYFKLNPSLKSDILEKSNKAILETVKNVVLRLKEKKYIKDLIKDIQIISPVNKGILGIENINKEIQAIFNNNNTFIEKSSTTFKLNDKVIHINRNLDMPCYKAIPDNPDEKPDFYDRIYNGMIGTIKHIDTDNQIVYVKYADFLVKYSKQELKEILNLAYAITIHKSQGSEYSNVIIPITLSHYNMLNNQLLYTAITRAKNRVILIGHSVAFEKACKSLSKTIRNTFSKIILDELSSTNF